jgi:3-deoxy-D-manno-octulosonic-acid transferase
MIYFIYDVLLCLVSLIYLPFYAIRGRVHRQLWARIGFFQKGFCEGEAGREVVWIHAVSVGEARAAEALISLMREAWPKKRLVVSTVTPTGYEIARKMLKEDEFVFYAPLDISFVVKKFLKCLKPSLLVILETELWPNLIRLTQAQGGKVVIVNGRISDRSFRRYAVVKRFLRPILDRVDLFCMQTPESAERVIALGAWHKKVHMTGNIKFDISSRLKEPAFGPALTQMLKGSLLWIAGSTHENEEEGVIRIYKSLHKDFGHLRLLIAPRHLERIDKIRRMIRLNGMESFLLSHAGPSSPASAVLILDTMGDLNAMYRLADIVYVGGSLVKKGGHNPIEPALFGKPILFGKFMFNFKEIRNCFLKEHAAIEVESPEALELELRKLLASPGDREKLGNAARGLIEKNRGAAGKTFTILRSLLK